MDVKVKCKVTNAMGFSNQVITSLTLEKKSSADAKTDLRDMSLLLVESEPECLQKA